MLINKVHHIAHRCIDAKQTVEWYGKPLGMKFVLAIAENEVPSTKAPDPYMHVFLDAGQGSIRGSRRSCKASSCAIGSSTTSQRRRTSARGTGTRVALGVSLVV